MAGLDRDPYRPRKCSQSGSQEFRICFQVRRELQQHGAQCITEARNGCHELRDRLAGTLQPLNMGQIAARFHSKHEVIRDACCPGLESLTRRQPVEGAVQFNRLELRAVEIEPI
jgi:hypothetical protein